jgi:hypothetical protein
MKLYVPSAATIVKTTSLAHHRIAVMWVARFVLLIEFHNSVLLIIRNWIEVAESSTRRISGAVWVASGINHCAFGVAG